MFTIIKNPIEKLIMKRVYVVLDQLIKQNEIMKIKKTKKTKKI